MDDAWHAGELLGLDFETTGVDRHEDVPVSFALVVARNGEIVEHRSALVNPERDIPAEATAIHGITTERAAAEGIPLAEAITLVADAVLEAERRGVPLVGMNLCFDLSILDAQLRRYHGAGLHERAWRGPVLDVLVLDRHLDRYRRGKRRLENLCAHYAVPVEQSHDAGADAASAIGVFWALCRHFPTLVEMDLATLTLEQARWHRTWAASYDDWRRGRGLEPLAAADYDWPLARFADAQPPFGDAEPGLAVALAALT